MLLPLRMRDNHLVRGLCQQSLVAIKPHISPAKVITHDEHNVGFVCRLGCAGNQAKRNGSNEMPEAIHARQHSSAKRGGNSVAASASADCGLTAGCLDAAAVNVPLHHGTPPAVADIELGDFFVVLGLGDLAALKLGRVFPKFRLVGGLEPAQFAIGGGAPGEEQSGGQQHGKVVNRLHHARSVRLAKPVVKQPSREVAFSSEQWHSRCRPRPDFGRMKIAIAIPTFNRVEHLKKAVQSALEQVQDDGLELYIAISNIASTDGTGRYLDQLNAAHERVIVYNQPQDNRKHPNGYFLAGIIPDDIDWVWLMGDDDYLMQKKLGAGRVTVDQGTSGERSLFFARLPGAQVTINGTRETRRSVRFVQRAWLS